MWYMNYPRLYFIACFYFALAQSISLSECDKSSNDRDITFARKVSESPIVVLGTSLNKNLDKNIRNLFNVTFLVHCVLKGRPTQRIISIVQAGSLLGRRVCQRLDANRQYIVFLEAFFDGTYRPVDFEEVLYNNQLQSLLDKTCGLSRTYPFTELNDTGGHLTNKCPPAVSVDCPMDTTKEHGMLSTSTTNVHMEVKAGSSSTATTVTTRSNLLGNNPVDLAVLSLLLSEHASHNFSLDLLQDQSHKSLFSDEASRRNAANKLPSIFINHLADWIFFYILYHSIA